jgi:hypothetical protein
MKCPTCPDAVEDHCCYCGAEIPAAFRVLTENPYAAEINDDYSLHMMCETCYDEALGDI